MLLKGWFTNLSSLFSIGLAVTGIIGVRQALAQTLKQNAIEEEQSARAPKLVSVIIPAHNEEDIIAQCLNAVLDQTCQNLPLEMEIIVANDNSTDSTVQILSQIKSDRLKAVNVPPPAGDWTGKTNALWQAYQLSNVKADWILFLDADTILGQNTIEAALKYALDQNLDLLSLAGRPIWKNIWTPLMMAQVAKFYTIAHTNPLQPPKPDTVEAASAIGTFILVWQAAYQAVGGHKAVKSSIIEDIELARAFRRNGFKTQQLNTPDLLQTLWYESFAELWEGVGKNMFAVADRRWSRVAFLLGVEWLYGLLPFLILIRQVRKGGSILTLSKLLNYLAVVSVLAFHNELNKGVKIPAIYSLGYPIAAVISSAITAVSTLRGLTGKKASWKGRKITVA